VARDAAAPGKKRKETREMTRARKVERKRRKRKRKKKKKKMVEKTTRRERKEQKNGVVASPFVETGADSRRQRQKQTWQGRRTRRKGDWRE